MRSSWHGIAIVLLAATIPLGEGLALACEAFIFIALVSHRRQVDWSLLWRSDAAPIFLGFALWFSAGLAALVLGGRGWLKPGEVGRWLPLLLMPMLLLSSSCVERRWFHRAAWAFAVMLALSCLFGLAQYGFNVRPFESIAHVDSSVSSQARVPGDFNRSVAGGFYFHRLKMAHVLLVGLAMLIARQMFQTLASWRLRLFELAVLVVMTLTLALTYTRGALLGAAVGAFACIVVASWRWRLVAASAMLLGILAIAAVPSLRERAASIASSEASSVRALVWSQAQEIIADHPIGAGLGNYSPIVGRYYDLVDPSFPMRTYPHNLVLAAWAETGPIGVVGYVWAWAAFAVLCFRRVRLSVGSRERAVAAFGLFTIVSFWAVGLTHDILYHNAVSLAFAASLGFVLVHLCGNRVSVA